MLVNNYPKQSPIIGIAGLGGGINSYIFLSGGADPYIISRSLRFNSADTSYLSKTFSSDGNRRTNTISFWIKKVKIDGSASFYRIFGSQQASHIYLYEDKIFWDASTTNNNSAAGYRWTNRLFRDTSAWYHIVCALDTTQSTASNRMRLYVNGVEETSFQATTNMGQNDQTGFSQGGIEHTFGYRSSNQGSAGGALDAYLADIHFIDGQALNPTEFGEFDTSGVWQPKVFDGTYGSNGFRLPFTDNSSSVALGLDYSQGDPGTNIKGMDIVTYTGNGGTQSLPLAFQPDFVWIKQRDNGGANMLFDSVRGVKKRLVSNQDIAEGTVQGVTSFDTNGFTLGDDADSNMNNKTHVAWCWKAGGDAVSNTDGSVTSQVSASTDYGFSICTFTSPSSGNFTLGHGLSSVPSLILMKEKAAGRNWHVFHSSISTGTDKYLRLNGTNSTLTYSNVWGDALPTSSVFGLGVSGSITANAEAVAYVWSEVAGFSKISSYTGNGGSNSITGLGFKPKYVLMKCSTKATSWMIADSTRGDNQILRAQTADVESTESISFSFGADGFSFNTSNDNFNESGQTYIYAAYAANPANDFTVNNLTAVIPKESANWLAMATGTPFNNDQLLANAFNGDASNQAAPGQGNTMSFTPTPAITGISKIRLKIRRDANQNDDNNLTLNGTVIGGSFTKGQASTVEFTTLGGSAITQLTNLSWSAMSSSNEWFGVYTIEIYYDGSYKTLVTNTSSGPNNIDSLVDSPSQVANQTDTGIGAEITGNYATWNPLQKGSSITLSNGNLDSTQSSDSTVLATIGVSSGKWYWETTIGSGNAPMTGLAKVDVLPNYVGGSVGSSYGYHYNGQKWISAVGSSYGDSYTTGDIIGTAFDADNGTLTFYKNGTTQGTAFTGLTSGTFTAAIGNAQMQCSVNFGQRAFAYPVSGYKCLNTVNLPEPTIADGSQYFDTKLYSGTGVNPNNITGLSFSPDWVWIKQRNGTRDHAVYDTIRGVTKELFPNGPGSENTLTSGLTSFNSDGFTVSTGSRANESGKTYASWNWEAGSSTVANTNGSINSQVRASATSGFSIVSYTGTASNATIGHGLSSAPDAVITKCLTGSNSWAVYHRYSGNGGALLLNVSDAEDASSAYWNNTHATSTVFSVGGSAQTNGSGQPFIAYCFSPVDSYSSFGSWIGTGDVNGPFLYTGFRPAWIMYKKKNGSSNWVIRDTKRSPHNVSDITLVAESSEVEGNSSVWNVDILSNGFKIRTTQTSSNNSGDTYVYFAFAENPFNSSRAR